MLLKDLTTLTASLVSGTLFHVEKSGKAYNIDYTKLAKAIVEEYNGSTLGGSAQTVQAAIGALNSRTSIFSYYAITSADLTETNNPLTIADSFVLRSGADVAYVSIANNNNLVEYAPCGYTVYEIRHMNDSVIVNVFSYVNRHLYVNTRTRNGAWKGWLEIS